MEGPYLFSKWCQKHGHPSSYKSLQSQNPNLSTAELDEKWDTILQKYEKDSFKVPQRGVITPESFGPHIKKG